MSPDEINAKHGKPTWRCWSCQADSGLTWWNGLSVAVCYAKPECHQAFSAFSRSEQDRIDAQAEADREWWGR